MAITVLNLSTYRVYAYGGVDGGIEALISLDVPGAFVSVSFYSDGAGVPPNRKEIHDPTGNPFFYLNYRLAMFGNIVDILRNEKPLKLQFNDVTLAAHITSSDEPIGEAEK